MACCSMLEDKFYNAVNRDEKYRAPRHRVFGGEQRARAVLNECGSRESDPHVQRVIKIYRNIRKSLIERYAHAHLVLCFELKTEYSGNDENKRRRNADRGESAP